MDNVTPLKIALFIGEIILFAGVLPLLCAHVIAHLIKKITGTNISPLTNHRHSKEYTMGILLAMVCFAGIVFFAGKAFSYYFAYQEKHNQIQEHAKTQNDPVQHTTSANSQATAQITGSAISQEQAIEIAKREALNSGRPLNWFGGKATVQFENNKWFISFTGSPNAYGSMPLNPFTVIISPDGKVLAYYP